MHTRLQHDVLGDVDVVRRRNSSRFSACWRGGVVRVTGPDYATDSQFMQALDALAPKLLQRREQHPATDVAERIELDGLTIELRRQGVNPDGIMLSPRIPVAILGFGNNLDIASVEGQRLYVKACRTIAYSVASQLLLPRAREIAAKLGCSPAGWKISRGSTVLGTCSSRGLISISYMCVFLPAALRDYIVCHELAHLTHMDHSEAFHRLLDAYLGGEEQRLVKELKNYRWPIPR